MSVVTLWEDVEKSLNPGGRRRHLWLLKQVKEYHLKPPSFPNGWLTTPDKKVLSQERISQARISFDGHATL